LTENARALLRSLPSPYLCMMDSLDLQVLIEPADSNSAEEPILSYVTFRKATQPGGFLCWAVADDPCNVFGGPA
jgi:hypothetical protein